MSSSKRGKTSGSSSRAKGKDKERSGERSSRSGERESKSKSTLKSASSSAKRRTASEEGAAPPGVAGPSAQAVNKNAADASADFEAGALFERYAHGGNGVDAKEFQRLWREHLQGPLAAAADARAAKSSSELPPDAKFEAGQLFERYNTVKGGGLSRADFEKLMAAELSRHGLPPPPAQANSQPWLPLEQASQPFGLSASSRTQRQPMAPNSTAFAPQPARAATAGPVGSATGAAAVSTFDGPADRYRRSGSGGSAGNVGPPLTHYNETTGVPLPKEAVAAQAALGHTVVPLSEAYERRLSRLQAIISSRLMPAREQLLQLRRRLLSRAEDVSMARAAIERETAADSGAILERLRSAEALKLAELAQRTADATAELEIMDNLTERAAGAAVAAGAAATGHSAAASRYANEFEASSRMVDLVQGYPELCAAVERAAGRPVDREVTVAADDLPHETAERLEVLRRADRYEQALAVKDQVVWTLLQESQTLEHRARAEQTLAQDYAAEAAEWAALTDKLAAELAAAREAAAAAAAASAQQQHRDREKAIGDRRQMQVLRVENTRLLDEIAALKAAAAAAAASGANGRIGGGMMNFAAVAAACD